MFNYAEMLLINKKFASAKANKKDLGVDFAAWDTATHTLYNAAYDVASKRYNGTGSVYGAVYEGLKGVYALIGELENGATLKCDPNTANTVIAFAGGMKTLKSERMDALMHDRSAAKKERETLLNTNGSSKKSIDTLTAKIAKLDKAIEKEKEKEWATWKDFKPVSFGTFEKNLEVYLADMIEQRKAMTLEELKAEKEAKKAEKKARKAEKKAA